VTIFIYLRSSVQIGKFFYVLLIPIWNLWQSIFGLLLALFANFEAKIAQKRLKKLKNSKNGKRLSADKFKSERES
jgi:hypothetical protein